MTFFKKEKHHELVYCCIVSNPSQISLGYHFKILEHGSFRRSFPFTQRSRSDETKTAARETTNMVT